MSVKISISCVVKGYYYYPFKVKEGEVFSLSKKRGEHGNAFKVWSERSQLGHLKADLVSPLWQHQVDISA